MPIRKCPDCGLHYLMAKHAMRCKPCGERYKKVARNSPDAVKKAAARLLTKQAIREGRIERGPCEVCGDVRVHAHHVDYDDPLNVKWLCPTHHTKHHAFMRWRASLTRHGRPQSEIDEIVNQCPGWAEERDLAQRWGLIASTIEALT